MLHGATVFRLLLAALVAGAQAGAAPAAQQLREHGADAAEPASSAGAAGCVKASKVALVDPGCPGEPSPEQVCPFEQVRLTTGMWDAEDGQWWMSVSFTTTEETIGAAQPALRLSNTAEMGEGKGCVLVFTGTTTAYTYVSAGGPYFSNATKHYQAEILKSQCPGLSTLISLNFQSLCSRPRSTTSTLARSSPR
jgi:hypothetical protein